LVNGHFVYNHFVYNHFDYDHFIYGHFVYGHFKDAKDLIWWRIAILVKQMALSATRFCF
jgi:hypothetical protein